MIELEKDMEDQLIAQLTKGPSQWTFRADLKTEDDLWKNIREKLNQNNLDVLNGVPLTDSEMEQVKNYVKDVTQTTYKAARWLSGEHRVSQIPVLRENAELGKVYLQAINSREIAGGTSSYEVIHQFQSRDAGLRDRRFDVTLLINGFPMIHIELKTPAVPYMDAFRQIQKYSREGKFRGLMGLVQMFVVSNGTETFYIAGAQADKLNENFLTRWVDKDNRSVENYLDFAKDVLSIPAAHRMIGKYSVLDNEKKSLILLRPYQIHAIEAVRQASAQRKSGFIWHTTGSGKTLTSFTVTKNLLDIPSVDKTVFLIDRKDLDQQTSANFFSYAESDNFDVSGTDNISALESELLSKDRKAIITTIQKFQHLLKKYEREGLSAALNQKKKTLQSKEIAFVVDECHRAVTPETKKQIDDFFRTQGRSSLWFGFTGTPIFEENKRAALGNLPRTTKDQYGECLHKYTIKEALKDKSVLGFQIQGLGLSEEELRGMADYLGSKVKVEADNDSVEEIEEAIFDAYAQAKGCTFFETKEHKERVVDYILQKSEGKLRLNAEEGFAYQAILTTENIADAQEYYKIFKERVAKGKVPESINLKLPDYPKIAITYTVGENEDGADVKQNEMTKSLQDYNSMFNTNFDLSTIKAYNQDLNERLSRKKSKFLNRSEQLDLVIVVDRLLTGFDSPSLSTIFIDRRPMAPHHLIQAISRTNRLHDNAKKFGQVVTLRFSRLFKKKIDEALCLYSNGSTKEVIAPSWKETRQKAKNAITEFKVAFPTVNSAAPEELGDDLEQLRKFAHLFQKVDGALNNLAVYDEYDKEKEDRELGFSAEKLEKYLGYYTNALERIKELTRAQQPQGPEFLEPFDIDYDLQVVTAIKVNYRYVVALIQSHIPDEEEQFKPITDKEDQAVLKYIKDYSSHNPQIGEILHEIWNDLKKNPDSFKGKYAFELVQELVDKKLSEQTEGFASRWGVSAQQLLAVANMGTLTNVEPVVESGSYEQFKDGGGSLSKLKYRGTLRKEVTKFLKEVVGPLRNF